MKIAATIQARMGSSRLPGKVLTPVSGKPMLLWQVERIRRSRLVDQVIIATSLAPADDAIESLCLQEGIEVFRGSEVDVLNRVAELIRCYEIDLHIECFGDSPLTDPQLVDEFIGVYLRYQTKVDFVSNASSASYPSGFEVNVYPGRVISDLESQLSTTDPLREHVGYNITRFPERFKLLSIGAPPYLRYPGLSLEVDTAEDLDLIRRVFDHFQKEDLEHFSLLQILTFFRKNPDLLVINSHVERRWKTLYEKTQ